MAAECILRAAFLLQILSVECVAQHPVIVVPQEHIDKPRFAPEPQRKLNLVAADLHRDLISDDSDSRGRALDDLLGVAAAPAGTAPPSDVSIRCLNLDEDPEAECVFTLRLGPPPTSIVLVTDHKSDGWYVVGQFEYWWHWNEEDADRLVELRPPYVLVRNLSGGTGLAKTEANVYRLWRGALYKTIGLEERGYAVKYGTSPLQTRTIENQIKFLVLNFSPWRALMLLGSEETSFTDADSGKDVRKAVTTSSCSAYEWAPATFSFERTRRATKEACP